MESYEILWKTTLPELEKTVTSISYETFIAPLIPVDIAGGKLVLIAQNKILADAVSGEQLAGKIKDAKLDDEDTQATLDRNEAIIFSMTPKERANPELLNPSRKKRIADGAGVDVGEVNRLVKQFDQAKKAMKQMPGLMKGGKKGLFGKMPF